MNRIAELQGQSFELADLTIMLSAPRGVTSTAGAKAYATKLAISPTITERGKKKRSLRNGY